MLTANSRVLTVGCLVVVAMMVVVVISYLCRGLPSMDGVAVNGWNTPSMDGVTISREIAAMRYIVVVIGAASIHG